MKSLCAWLLVVITLGVGHSPAQGSWVVGSKNFSESRLLAEIFAQLLEDRSEQAVERRFDLAGTSICFRALREGELDVYPEYTGTGLVTLLGEAADADADRVLNRVRRVFRERWNLHWLAPLGFENSYEVAVRRAVAEEYDLRTISDLAAVSAPLRFAFGYEFQEREDGLIGLRRAYGLQPTDLRALQQTLKYRAAGDAAVDVLDVYTTDGLILVHDLVVLRDDRGVFPAYQAAPLVRGGALAGDPVGALALGELAGRLDEARMRELNRRVEVEQQPVEAVAAAFLSDEGLVVRASGEGDPALESSSPWARAELGRRTLEHLGLVGMGLGLGLLLALPLGFWLSARPRLAEPVVRLSGILQTIPSIALLAFLIPALGIGAPPAVAALFLYSLFPILRNTVTGLADVDPAVLESARALGMTSSQSMRWVRIPLAMPTILAGVRTAAVITVGTATLAAFIGAGGLGRPIVSGLQLDDHQLILSGAVPAALLAWGVDALLGGFESRLRPRTGRSERS